MRVEYSKRALADLRRIAAYHARSDDPDVGDRIADAVRDVAARLAGAPRSGRPVEQRPGVRVVLLLRYRYLIFYKVIDEETVRVLHVRHTSRRSWAR